MIHHLNKRSHTAGNIACDDFSSISLFPELSYISVVTFVELGKILKIIVQKKVYFKT